MSEKPYTIVFVCTGNTCRSPMAEHLLKHALKNEGEPLSEIRVLSAGIAAGAGYPPSRNSEEAMSKVGIDISDHATQQASPELLDEADLVIGMTHSHIFPIQEALGESTAGKLRLMRSFIPETNDLEIPDPFGMNLSAYENARDSMVEAIPGILDYLRNLYNTTPQ